MNWYYAPGSGRIKAHRVTMIERYQIWKRRRERSREILWNKKRLL